MPFRRMADYCTRRTGSESQRKVRENGLTSKPLIVAFQGIHGANSDLAVRQHFAEMSTPVETLPCYSFKDLFKAVESGQATYALLPVENSLAGSVADAYELLLEHDLSIHAEVIMRIRYALMAVAGTPLSTIKRTLSHPQALAQCERYLLRRNIEPVVWFDTAGSARDLAASPQPNTAAIAPPLAATLYGLEILDEGIENEAFNFTRFFLIGFNEPPRGEHSKTSIVFALHDRPAALYDTIGELATRGINMTKIESRPHLKKAWQYNFYVDFEGHAADLVCEGALAGILRRSTFLKILGSYPPAPLTESRDAEISA
jgi:prephenate dehydratase